MNINKTQYEASKQCVDASRVDSSIVDRPRLLRYCEAIEASVQIDQFDECALLLSELISLVRDSFGKQKNLDVELAASVDNKAIGRALGLLNRCRDPLHIDDLRARDKLRDDIRNGLILLLSDVVDGERQIESLQA